jgi:hypothetical protein
MNDNSGFEVWTDGHGCQLALVPVAFGESVDELGDEDGYDGWFAESAGQRAPQRYEMRTLVGFPVEVHVVFPVEPWTAYDAISDRLIREGWTPPVADMVGECEHGLSADLCFGPNHYYDERYA